MSCESKRIVHRLASPLCAGRARELALSDGAPSPTGNARRLRSNGPSGPAVRSSSPLGVFTSGGSAALHTESRWVIYLFIISYTRGYLFIFCHGCFPKKEGRRWKSERPLSCSLAHFWGRSDPVGHTMKKKRAGLGCLAAPWSTTAGVGTFFWCPVHLARGIIRAYRRGGSQQQRQQK